MISSVTTSAASSRKCVGLLLAAHAAAAMASAQRQAQFWSRLWRRIIWIGQAKGILMQRYQITAAGVLLLIRASQKANFNSVTSSVTSLLLGN
jgi:hypothetical protein